ncbi:MAG: response regulator [Magnetococcus sp. WYHC-3]
MAIKHVLMVDDSRLARMMLRGILTQGLPGWQILEADSAAQALERVADVVPDLALIDYNMPDRDGLSLAIELKQRFPGLSAHLVTANIQDRMRDRALTAGVGFIQKPITRERLLESLPIPTDPP